MPIFSVGKHKPELRGDNHYIAHDATLVGDITLENNVSIWYQVVIRAENDKVHIGEGTNIQDGAILHVDPGYPLSVGRRVTVGHKAMLHGCTVGDGALIGINSVILNGARVGANTLIGANTLVGEGKEIPEGVLVFGTPGVVIRKLKQEEIDKLQWIAGRYVERSKMYRNELREIPLPPSALPFPPG